MSKGDFKLIVGLGNPGSKFNGTRHNVGFMAVETIAKEESSSFKLNKKFLGKFKEVEINNQKIKLLLPDTFMNESGRSVVATMNWFDFESSQLLVIVDDIDLPLGKIRIRRQGGSGGHNGLKSIISNIGTNQFCRLRIGIGRPNSKNINDRRTKTVPHVLGVFNKQEKELMDAILSEVVIGVRLIQQKGFEIGANYLNSYLFDLKSI